jgi:hypothetical protein
VILDLDLFLYFVVSTEGLSHVSDKHVQKMDLHQELSNYKHCV